ncbi:DUF3618 domain-containing protein [Streptomyces alkaliphilus]|uniref:DUF3618 domain-containing protein n=1 Tax=Streptomyces alkaliphilus TaxID=1472722 RepID=UPI002B1FB90A|nr:DUF3618 domain-containing protein [Streptomyces alkaliphilus]
MPESSRPDHQDGKSGGSSRYEVEKPKAKESKAKAEGPEEIEARIRHRRAVLADTLDELAVRVHPKTIVGDVRTRALSVVDRRAGQAYIAVNRTVSGARTGLMTRDGSPRPERLIPIALVAVGVVGLLVLGARRRRR